MVLQCIRHRHRRSIEDVDAALFPQPLRIDVGRINHPGSIVAWSGGFKSGHARAIMEDEARELQCPLDLTVVIVLIPKNEYATIQFIENKKPVKKVETVTANPP